MTPGVQTPRPCPRGSLAAIVRSARPLLLGLLLAAAGLPSTPPAAAQADTASGTTGSSFSSGSSGRSSRSTRTPRASRSSRSSSSSGSGFSTRGTTSPTDTSRSSRDSSSNRYGSLNDRNTRTSSRRASEDETFNRLLDRFRDTDNDESSADRARSGQERTAVERQNVPAAAAAGAAGAAAAGAATAGGGRAASGLRDVALPADSKSNALFFQPANAVQRVGDRFSSTLKYFNRLNDRVDRIDLWLRFDPAVIEPVWVDLGHLEPLVSGPLTAEVYAEEGLLHLAADVAGTLGGGIIPLAEIHWQASKAITQTRVEAVPVPGRPSGLFAEGRNVLVDRLFEGLNNVSLRIEIRTGTAEDDEASTLLGTLAGASADIVEALPPDLERLRLAVIPREPSLAPGHIGVADIVVLNPGGLSFDELRLRLRYDPSAVTILDADEDNYISLGLNIFDGDFHETFPFDFHGRNIVDPDRGLIEYHVRRQSGPLAYPGGTVARIVFRMLAPAGEARFWFETTDAITGLRTTDVSANGRSLLGPNDRAPEALHAAVILPQR